jgi:hypothetical protein
VSGKMGLELVEIVMDVEDYFGISLPDAVVSDCNTVSDLHKAIVGILVERGHGRAADVGDQVYQDLVRIISQNMGMAVGEIRPASRLVGDVTKYG